MIKSVPLSLLVEDWSIYPRHAVDEVHVASLLHALMAGNDLPLIVAEESSLRIVDGWHRARSYIRFLGADASVNVELVSYPSEDDLLLDSIARNASHGRKLDRTDQVRAITMADNRNIERSLVASALHITTERAGVLRVRLANAPSPSPYTVPGTPKVVLKRCVSHLEGRELTRDQTEAVASSPGTSYSLLARQLTDGLRYGLLDLSRGDLVERLRELHREIDRVLVSAS